MDQYGFLFWSYNKKNSDLFTIEHEERIDFAIISLTMKLLCVTLPTD